MEIRLEGVVGDDFTAQGLASDLQEAGGPVDVIVNSIGGSAFEGAACYAELRAHPVPVTVRIRGVAASAASLLAMGGDTVLIAPAAVMMIHDPLSITIGNADVHRQTIEMLDQLSTTYARAYAEGSGNPERLIRQWMAAESWITDEEAVSLGFADALEPEPEPATDFPSATALAHRPAAFIAQPVFTI